MGEFIMSLDQGTTSSRAIIFDHNGLPCAVAQKEFTQYYPRPGWVEHDPEEIWSTQAGVALEAITKAGLGSIKYCCYRDNQSARDYSNLEQKDRQARI